MMREADHVAGIMLRWAVASPAHALWSVAGVVALCLLLRSRPQPERAPRNVGGVAALVVAAGGLLTGWWLIAHPQKTAPPAAAAPRPVTRTVIVHDTVTKVIHVGSVGLTWPEAAVAVVALGIACGLMWRRAAS